MSTSDKVYYAAVLPDTSTICCRAIVCMPKHSSVAGSQLFLPRINFTLLQPIVRNVVVKMNFELITVCVTTRFM